MANYFAVYNDNNNLLLNDTYKNLYLSKKIPITKVGTYTGTFSDGEVLAAVGGIESKDVDIDAYCQNLGTGYNCVVNTYVSGMYIYVFTVKRPKRDSGLGLQLLNSNGDVIFDSLDPHPKILAFGNSTGAVSVGKKPAIAVAPNITYLTNELSFSHDSLRYATQEFFPDRYDWVIVYNPPGVIPSFEYRYQLVEPAHFETVWHTRYNGYVHLISTRDHKNFRLNNGVIKESLVSTNTTVSLDDSFWWDDSDREVFKWGESKLQLFAQGKNKVFKTIIRTQSYLLMDVDGL